MRLRNAVALALAGMFGAGAGTAGALWGLGVPGVVTAQVGTSGVAPPGAPMTPGMPPAGAPRPTLPGTPGPTMTNPSPSVPAPSTTMPGTPSPTIPRPAPPNMPTPGQAGGPPVVQS